MTTKRGKDYKCRKSYKQGNCSYTKGNIYHSQRDGYLNDDNNISWSCSESWFKEYIDNQCVMKQEDKYIKENNLDEIDAFLFREFGILGGACSAQMASRYYTARQVAEKLWNYNNEDSLYDVDSINEMEEYADEN